MLKISDSMQCDSASTESDAYVPLTLNWNIATPHGVLYAYLESLHGGYVELKFEKESLALVEAIVIDTPPECDRCIPLEAPAITGYSPCASPDNWPWRDSADLPEPANDSIDLQCDELCFTQSGTAYFIRLSAEPPIKFIEAGNVAVGVSENSRMCGLRIRGAA